MKERIFSPLPRDVSLEELVPKDNFYRRLEERLDFQFVREVDEDHANPSILSPLRVYRHGGRCSILFLAQRIQRMGVYPDGGRHPQR
jgi:hypothetical protein